MKNRYNFLVRFLIAILSLSTSSLQSAARTPHTLRSINTGLDVASKVITNLAMTNHIDNPAGAATMHALAASLGIARDLALAKLLYDDPKNMLNGDYFTISSSAMAHLIDLIVHCSNFKKKNPYLHVNTANKISIRTAQALGILTNYFAHYNSIDLCQKQEFQTAMYNLHTGIEAVEKILVSQHCTAPIIDQKIIRGILASSAVLNTISAGYYTVQAASDKKDTHEEDDDDEVVPPVPAGVLPPVLIPANQAENDFICPVCQEGRAALAADNAQVVRLAACNHALCLECTRGAYEANANAMMEVPGFDGAIDGVHHAIAGAPQPNGEARALHARGHFNCPVCRVPALVRDILRANPPAA